MGFSWLGEAREAQAARPRHTPASANLTKAGGMASAYHPAIAALI